MSKVLLPFVRVVNLPVLAVSLISVQHCFSSSMTIVPTREGLLGYLFPSQGLGVGDSPLF